MAMFDSGTNIRLLYNLIDFDHFEMSNLLGNTINFGMISSNNPQKGLVEFIGIAQICAKRFPQARFIVVGPITPVVKQAKACQNRGQLTKNLIFTGYIKDSRQAVSMINVMLSLSEVPESFGRSIAEGIAAEKPVIAINSGAMPELVKHSHNGFLVKPKDIKALQKYIEFFCEHPDKIVSMGKLGKKFLLHIFPKRYFSIN
ncbi:hypothetical protein BOW52_10665 [Solemya elarraichensis gill symbiont]|uniref:Glycosyl transferase family 1 domain-containing protein n=2 Tax=Solemya elarraichensis gill symbiont TaxID=1918949 RepID=A0A1T2KV14_9GAMM|nr:hypothetical protein BOW52_10665 [Solemya elarraichensis gill symbiont]